MLAFFRRALSSWMVLALLALLVLAVVVTGVGDPFGTTGSGPRDEIAKVGGESIDASDLTTRLQLALENERAQNPGLDMSAYLAGGAAERTALQLVAARAMEIWARGQGMVASDRLIDGEIASIPAFKGPTGAFDRLVFQQLLAQRKISEAQLRGDMAGDLIRRQVLLPVAGGAMMPDGVVTPYASLLLERREGVIGLVPTAALPPGKPATATEIEAHYRATINRYTLPERRVVRYALIGREQIGAQPTPSAAEIAAFYKANAATYAGRETRALSEIVLPGEAQALAFVAKVKGGQSFPAAAQAAGFTPADTARGEQSREQLAGRASAAVADAAFALAEGATTGAIKSELGWHIVHVDKVIRIGARPLAAVRDEIAASIARQKTDEAIAAKVESIEDRIAGGATFDEVIAAEKLAAVTTPAVLPDGQAPDQPGYKAPPVMGVLLKAAFDSAPEDDPTVEVIGAGELHGLVDVVRVLPSAPRALAQVREAVAADLARKRASERARAVAQSILARVDAGTAMDKAVAEAGLRLPPPQKVGGRQADLSQPGRPVPPPLAMMFAMTKGKTRLLAAPGDQGWFIVQLQTIEPGDATRAPGLIAATGQQFARVLGDEYIEQFANAVARDVGVKRDDAALARLKATLAGGR